MRRLAARTPAARLPSPQPAPRAAHPGPIRTTPRAGCACGGGCPRCGGARMSLDTSGEREANHIATRAIGAGVAEPLLRTGLSRARLHTGPEAADSAAALDAAAFAIGDDIVFGAGRYRPDTPAGQWLIAHEAAHVGQQARDGRPALRRQPADVVEMPPLTVTSTLNPVEKSVSHLDRLRDAGVTPLTPTISRLPADVDRNSPDPAARLPFTPNGWDGGDILLRLGQFDRMPGTDSDAMRCVQAVGMAARVPDGPAAVVSYLQALILQGMLRPKATDRQRTATEVLEHVIGRIETRRATFGDMAWAQEAMHDLFYNDVSGTPEPDILPAIAPAMDLTKTLQRMDLWCDTPQQVMAQATQLQPGEQLIIEAWTVSLNTAFDQVSEQGIEVREGESVVVNVNGRLVRIRRIPMNQRPPHTALDLTRDSKTGHQLLILKDAADGALRLYEPEITASGQHLEKLAADGSNFVGYFHDQPAFGMYHYIQIIGKLRPGSVTPSAAWP